MCSIGDRIKAQREALGISQDELARKLGYQSRSSINKIESGERDLPQSKIKAIADALCVSPSFIMGWCEKPADPWNSRFRESLRRILSVIDTIDAHSAGISIDRWHEIANDDSPLSLETCCYICEMAGESLDDMVELRDTELNKSESHISAEAQKIAAAFDKATAKEKQMVRLALSEYLDTEEEIKPVRIAALSNDSSAIDFSGANPDAEIPVDFTKGPDIP